MTDSLEYLFGSKTKLRILKALVLNPKLTFTASDMAGRIKSETRVVSFELKKMHVAGIIKRQQRKNEIFYSLHRGFVFYSELKSMVAKCNITPESPFLKELKNSGKIIYAVLTGIFTDNRKSEADLIVAGENLNKKKIKRIISDIEVELGREIRYSIMTSDEIVYRLEMFDKFLSDINKGPSIVLVDKIQEEKRRLRAKKRNAF